MMFIEPHIQPVNKISITQHCPRVLRFNDVPKIIMAGINYHSFKRSSRSLSSMLRFDDITMMTHEDGLGRRKKIVSAQTQHSASVAT